MKRAKPFAADISAEESTVLVSRELNPAERLQHDVALERCLTAILEGAREGDWKIVDKALIEHAKYCKRFHIIATTSGFRVLPKGGAD